MKAHKCYACLGQFNEPYLDEKNRLACPFCGNHQFSPKQEVY